MSDQGQVPEGIENPAQFQSDLQKPQQQSLASPEPVASATQQGKSSPEVSTTQMNLQKSTDPVSQNQSSKQQSSQRVNQQIKITSQSVLKEIRQLNDTVISDISVRKGRKEKFINHLNKLQHMQKQFENNSESFTDEEKSTIYQKFTRLGENQLSLETAILLLELSKSNRYLVVRWKMQLAAMRSSISHKSAYKAAVQTMSKITTIVSDLALNLKQSKPKLSSFLELVLKVINSGKRNDFIWIHNFENNMKCFTDHIRQLMFASEDYGQQKILDQEEGKSELILNSNTHFKIQPFYSGYDFQIADYMSLQKLDFDYIEKYNESTDIKQIAKEIVIYASICCFTQATQSYYMGDYSLKYLHFKAVQIALLAVDRECTYVGFLLKILNDYYGTKMSEIREENSQLMEINQLKRRMPRDKRQISLKNLLFAE